MYKKLTILLLLMSFTLFVAGCQDITTTTPVTTTAAPITTVTTTETPTTVTTTESPTTITTAEPTTFVTTTNNNVMLPDLAGESQATITDILEDLGLEVVFSIDVSRIYEENEYDKFIKYGSNLQIGDPVELGSLVRVFTSPLHLEIKYLYQLDEYEDDLGNPLLLQDADYQGKEFIADGIGVVTVQRYIDGDTTWFTSGSQSFSVRYLGIDTPESTALYEPWGKAAARYTEAKLKNAETIVLQAEGERQDGNGRYLAWVWYRDTAEDDFILLNLELVELAYSKNKVSVGSKFTMLLTLADWDASLTKRRVWGEIDPEYDYSRDGAEISIMDLMLNFDDVVGLKAIVTGTITRKVGNNIYLQDDTGYGVYMYAGFTTSAQLQVGANVTIGGLVPTYFSGSPQLTNFKRTLLWVNDPVAMPEPLLITNADFEFARIGTLVEVQNLYITSINMAGNTVYVRDAQMRNFSVRIDDSTQQTATTLGLSVGKTISVIGPLGYYDFDWEASPDYVYSKSKFQVMLTDVSDITIHD